MEELSLIDIGGYEVYFRKDDEPIKAINQSMELERIINELTGEEFQDYKGKRFSRKLKYPERFTYVCKYTDSIHDKLTCLCSENTCDHLIITHYIPKDIYFAVGSVCVNRFDEDNSKDLYNLINSKKCKTCNKSLVFKEGGKFEKNTKKKCYGRCFECVRKYNSRHKLYINCPYECKDDAKSKGAWWDGEKKKWYIWSDNPNYKYLLDKYVLHRT